MKFYYSVLFINASNTYHFLAFFEVNTIISSRNIKAPVLEAINVGLQVLQIHFGVLSQHINLMYDLLTKLGVRLIRCGVIHILISILNFN